VTAVSLNHDQGLYVIPAGNGFSCLGFDVLEARLAAVAAWLGTALPTGVRATLGRYAQYRAVLATAEAKCSAERTRCPAELTPALIGLEGSQVEVTDCWGETRRFVVGRSTGWMPCHLELATARDDGGAAVMGAPFTKLTVVKRVRSRYASRVAA